MRSSRRLQPFPSLPSNVPASSRCTTAPGGSAAASATSRPLGENLRRNALNAAFSDPRFPPLEPDELGETLIELSILTPPRPIEDPTAFLIGVDGIILRQGSRGAVFLPQVALEQGWDQRTTLEYLSRKAGLPANGWQQPGTVFQTFRAEVFGE